MNNDPALHNTPQDYTYTLNQDLQDGAVNVAIGVLGIEFNSHSVIDFTIDYIPETLLRSLKFRVQVNDVSLGWKTLKFNFFATQSPLFQVLPISVNQNQFSNGSA